MAVWLLALAVSLFLMLSSISGEVMESSFRGSPDLGLASLTSVAHRSPMVAQERHDTPGSSQSLPLTDRAAPGMAAAELSNGWTEVFPTEEPPAASWDAMTYDSATGSIILFGGQPNSYGLVNQTWVYERGQWSQLHPIVSPPALIGAAMAYDAADGYALLFGGETLGPMGQVVLNETWTFQAGEWTQLHVEPSPSPRAYASMAYDSATSEILLFGGTGSTLPYQPNDTWSFSAGAWTKLAPASAPPLVSGPGVAYDPLSRDLVVFGGDLSTPNGTIPSNQTWTFNGTEWAQTRSLITSPSARIDPSLAFDPGESAIVLFGGCLDESSGISCANDTWLFTGSQWSLLETPIPIPNGSDNQALAYDATDGYLVLYEGVASGGEASATWVFVAHSEPGTQSLFLGLPETEGYALLGGVIVALAAGIAAVWIRRHKGP